MGSSRRHPPHDAPLRQSRPRTRQHKGTLADPEQNTQQLTAQLRALGLYAANTLGDGNCLFRALADQYYGSPSQHLHLRHEICDWLAAHNDRYAPFVDDERGLDVHLRCMRQAGTYGGHLELSAFAHLKRRNVKVIQPGLIYVIEWSTGNEPVPETPASETVQPPDPSSSPALSDRDRRRLRREKRKETIQKGRVAKVAEAAAMEDDDDDGEESGAIYVAYHDWEHFSSVRSLSGPHAGLPRVVERPAHPAMEDEPPSTPSKAKGKNKPLSSAKHRQLHAAHSTSASLSASSSPPPPAAPPTLSPKKVPLPPSRSISPAVSSETSTSGSSSFSLSSASTSMTSTSTSAPGLSKSVASSRVVLRIDRSPKRSFDESSAGTSSSSGLSSHGQGDERGAAKRSRSSMIRHEEEDGGSSENATEDDDDDEEENEDDIAEVDIQIDRNMDVDPGPEVKVEEPIPGFRFLGNISSSSSPLSSPAPTPPPPSMVVVPPSPIIGTDVGGAGSDINIEDGRRSRRDRPMTQRGRKALGLPKPRPAVVGGAGATTGRVAGASGTRKIVIPGGRFKKDDVTPTQDAMAVEEWTSNGAGRLDVRGFRELKI